MRLSTRGRFAITAMIDLALRDSGQPVPLQDIALRHRISLSYLEQVFAKLRQHGLVESTRGPGGGYTLGFRGNSITVADIIGAIEDTADAGTPRDGTQDMTQDLWAALQTTIVAHMKTITLKSLAQEQRAKGNRGYTTLDALRDYQGVQKTGEVSRDKAYAEWAKEPSIRAQFPKFEDYWAGFQSGSGSPSGTFNYVPGKGLVPNK